MARSGEVTRERLLDAAERLCAEHGVESVSMRDIAAAAGQRNNSAIRYHFGDRAGLVAAVLARRMEGINVRRQEMIDAIDARSDGQSLDAMLRAFVEPLTDVVVDVDGWYARFLVRMYGDVFAMRVLAELPEAAPMRELDTRIRSLLADLDPVVRQSRIDQLMMLVTTTLARWEWAGDHGRRRLGGADLSAEIRVTGRAVLTAPAALS